MATIENLLGMPPMTITDSRSSPMWAAFGARARLRPYDAIRPTVVPFGAPGFPTNAPSAPMAAAAARWNLRDADASPEIALNRAIWKSIKGRASRMPRPRHDKIIGPGPDDEDD